jgi:hypothetical protein
VVSIEPDAAAVKLDDLLRHGQSDSGSSGLVSDLQALEDDENSVGVPRIDPDTSVFDGHEPLVAERAGADADGRWRVPVAVAE